MRRLQFCRAGRTSFPPYFDLGLGTLLKREFGSLSGPDEGSEELRFSYSVSSELGFKDSWSSASGSELTRTEEIRSLVPQRQHDSPYYVTYFSQIPLIVATRFTQKSRSTN